MTPGDYIEAARVPYSIKPQTFGLWGIRRVPAQNEKQLRAIGWTDYTILHRMTEATMHQEIGEIVMEDSICELYRHMPIWLAARGRVLITGLGLGCVLRGLLAKSEVEHIDVIEIDADIIRVVGAEFSGNPRATIHHADAMRHRWPEGTKWDFAWHDIWMEDGAKSLHMAHSELLFSYRRKVAHQGAWQLPRFVKRLWREPLLGA
jgi:spermidine synthase